MTREYTDRLLEMIDEGILDRDLVIMACVKYMSEDQVRDMMEINEIMVEEDELEEDQEEDSDPLDDFNYVGSRHHY